MDSVTQFRSLAKADRSRRRASRLPPLSVKVKSDGRGGGGGGGGGDDVGSSATAPGAPSATASGCHSGILLDDIARKLLDGDVVSFTFDLGFGVWGLGVRE